MLRLEMPVKKDSRPALMERKKKEIDFLWDVKKAHSSGKGSFFCAEPAKKNQQSQNRGMTILERGIYFI